jgi:phage gp29-like protein
MAVEKGLVDAYGRPVRTSRLTKEVATVSMASVRSPWQTSVANVLTPSHLGTIVEAMGQNDGLEYLTLAEEMEEREPHYRSVLSTRKLAVSGLEWVVEAVSDDAKDVEIADFVREIFQKNAFDVLRSDLLDGLAKGYSVSEIIWDRGDIWTPREYKWRDQRHFQFDDDTGAELRMRDESDPVNGIELQPYKFIVHEPRLKTGLTLRSGLARVACVSYMCKTYTMKDWLAFIEVFGMPLRLGKYEDMADAEQKSTLLNAVARLGIDAAAIIPKSMEIEFVETGVGKGSMNDKIFSGMAEYLDSMLSKCILGQTMTTDDGASLSQAKVHDEVRDDIKINDAKQLAATIRRDVVKAVVDLNFPGPHERYPIYRHEVEEPEDLVALSQSLPPFIKLGLEVEQSAILDKFGLEEPEEGAKLLGLPTPQQPEGGDDGEGEESDIDDTSAKKEPAPDTTRARAGWTTNQLAIYELIFSKVQFPTVAQVKTWVQDEGYKWTEPTESDDGLYYRVNQWPLKDFVVGSFESEKLAEGVHSVYGRLNDVKMAREDVIDDLMRRVHRGEDITPAQERVLEVALAREPKGGTDTIDRLVDRELKGWQPVMDPILAPIFEAADNARSYSDLQNRLKKASKDMDTDKFVESLALAMFKARGLGDGTDKS